MSTPNQKRHDSVLSWGAQRTGSAAQRELTDLEPASGEHNKAHQNALNGYYSYSDEPSMNSFVYGSSKKGASQQGSNNIGIGHGHGSKRAMSAFERHRPKTPMSMSLRRKQQDNNIGNGNNNNAEDDLLFEDGNGSASLLGKATRVFSFPFSSNRKNPFRSTSPSTPVSSASISLAAKTTTSKSLPSTASKSTAPLSVSMSMSLSTARSHGNTGTVSVPLATMRSLPRPTFPRSHVAHISKRTGIMEARLVQAETELREQREKNAKLRDKIKHLENHIRDTERNIPDVENILRAAIQEFEDREKVVKYRLHEALKKQ